jgi:hypothetical protein
LAGIDPGRKLPGNIPRSKDSPPQFAGHIGKIGCRCPHAKIQSATLLSLLYVLLVDGVDSQEQNIFPCFAIPPSH